MSTKLKRLSLESELAGVREMLASISPHDYASQMAFESRAEQLEAELSQLSRELGTLANVTLVFKGGPVQGSRSIDANFAADALKNFQELISKQIAHAHIGGLASRGPIPVSSASCLNITGVVHGSFGFTLEELDPAGTPLLPSALRETLDQALKTVEAVSSVDDAAFAEMIEELDARVFVAIKKFVNTLYKGDASLTLLSNDVELPLDKDGVARAHERVERSDVDELEYAAIGRLIGVMPIARRFEFLPDGNAEVVSGKVGPRLSDQFLERIERDEAALGGVWNALLHKKITSKPDGSIKETFVLLDLKEEAK